MEQALESIKNLTKFEMDKRGTWVWVKFSDDKMNGGWRLLEAALTDGERVVNLAKRAALKIMREDKTLHETVKKVINKHCRKMKYQLFKYP